jgi:hypothetical protein
MIRTIQIPKKVASDYAGYSFFARLHAELKPLQIEKVILDFGQNTWFEANLCAALGAIIYEAETRLNQISIHNLSPTLQNLFGRNHFSASFGGYEIIDHYDTTIKYRRNQLSDDKRIRDFLNSELINKPDFPKLSVGARKEIIRSIFEIYSNAIIHGNCEYVFSCGQFYPQKQPPRIDFTIIDVGRTIKSNVSEFLKHDISGIEAIVWALQESNTTKPKDKNIPGGLGFKIISDFARLNNGKVQIVSDNGCWQLTRGKEEKYTMEHPFPGTLVNLEFNLDDKSFYYLEQEKPQEIIF